MLAWILRLLGAKTIHQARSLLLHRVLEVTPVQIDSSHLRYLSAQKLISTYGLNLNRAAIHIGKHGIISNLILLIGNGMG